MRPTRLSLASLLLASLAFLASPALAGPGGGMEGPPEGRLEQKLKKLGLDESQQQKVQAILDAARPQREETRQQMRGAFDDMRALLDQDAPDQSAVLAQADKIGQIQTQMHKEMLTTLLAVRAELNPAQRAKLKEAWHEHGGGPGHWRRFHRGGSPGSAGTPPEESPEN